MADLFTQLIAHRQRSDNKFQFTAFLVVDIGNAQLGCDLIANANGAEIFVLLFSVENPAYIKVDKFYDATRIGVVNG
jgi:hypothetical protein